MAKNGLRANSFMIVLYPDDERFSFYESNIIKNFEYLSILHDRDIDENGIPKKKHIHFVIRSIGGAVPLSSVCSLIGCPANYIEPLRSYKYGLLYCVHANEPEKVQYSINDCKGTLVKDLDRFLSIDKKTESEKVLSLLDFINKQYCTITIGEFAEYCAKNELWDVFRRSGVIFVKMIDEHNRFIKEYEYKKINNCD